MSGYAVHELSAVASMIALAHSWHTQHMTSNHSLLPYMDSTAVHLLWHAANDTQALSSAWSIAVVVICDRAH